VRAYPGLVRSLLRLAGWVALTAGAACSGAPAPANPQLWTLFTDQALYAGGASPAHAIAAADGLPGGIPLDLIVNGTTLAERTALANGEPVTFLTTEVWANYPQVWMQPAYAPITGWAADGTPKKLVDAAGAWHPIFSVGPQSGFYSPFWQIVYFQVPAGTAPDAFTSARDVLDGGFPLTPGEGRTMPLAPAGLSGGGTPGTAAPKSGQGWLDGASVAFLDFGSATFTWDPASNVIQAAPIYVLTLAGPDGAAHAFASIPTVLGDSPPSPGNGTPVMVDGQWRLSAYWRVNTVVVPPGARVFAPPGSQVASDLAEQGLSPGTYTSSVTGADPTTYQQFEGWVALNPDDDPVQGTTGCFDDPTSLATCTWLNSEAVLQSNLDLSTTEPTAISVSWEIVGEDGVPVEAAP
jgi:hypothetical protein